MRIVIDLQGAQTESRFRGIGRYSLALAEAITRLRGNHEVFIALSGLFPDTIAPIKAVFAPCLPSENIHVWQTHGPLNESEEGNAWRRSTAELTRESFLASLEPDLILVTSLFEGYLDSAATSIGRLAKQSLHPTPQIAVIHYDLIPYLAPETYLNNARILQYYEKKIEWLLHADLILAISESSAKEAIDVLGIDPKKTAVISAASDPQFKPITLSNAEQKKIQDQYGINRNMILYAPGGFDPRKNFEGLIKAYALLPAPLKKEYQLVIVSKVVETDREWIESICQQSELADVILTGYVPETDLIALYNMASVFVFPSKHEGFGLPVLEAMSCGAPTIGSNTTSIPEVIGLESALFDPESIDAISHKIRQVLEQSEFRAQLQHHALVQAKKFSWDASAKLAWAAFDKQIASLDTHVIVDPSICYAREAALIRAITQTNTSTELPTEDDLIATTQCINQNRINLNQTTTNRKQLLLDVSVLSASDAKTGIQRVVRELSGYYLKNPPLDFKVMPVRLTETGYVYAHQFALDLLGQPDTVFEEPAIVVKPGDLFLGLDLMMHVSALLDHHIEKLRAAGVKTYLVVYDLLPLFIKQCFTPKDEQYFMDWIGVTRGADGILAISKAVADEYKAYWMQLEKPLYHDFTVDFFHLGANITLKNTTEIAHASPASSIVKRSMPSFLMVSTIEPRKNHQQALAAFELLWQKGLDIQLIIIGRKGWHIETFIEKLRHHPELNKRLFWFDNVNDSELTHYYRTCDCLISTSLGEGFGLPLIEAAQYGLPMLVRDLAVFQEIAAEHAYYFSGLEAKDLADAIENWLQLNQVNKAPQSKEMPYLTWAESAEQLLSRVIQ